MLAAQMPTKLKILKRSRKHVVKLLPVLLISVALQAEQLDVLCNLITQF